MIIYINRFAGGGGGATLFVAPLLFPDGMESSIVNTHLVLAIHAPAIRKMRFDFQMANAYFCVWLINKSYLILSYYKYYSISIYSNIMSDMHSCIHAARRLTVYN